MTGRDLQRRRTFNFNPEVKEFSPRGGQVPTVQPVSEPEGPADDDDEGEGDGEENVRRSEGEDEVEYLDESGPGEVRREALGSDRGGSDSEDGVRDQQLPAGVEAEGGRSGLRVSGVENLRS